MSRFSGRYYRGALRDLRRRRSHEAYLRQVAGVKRCATVRGVTWSYENPRYFLSRSDREQVERGNLEIA
jgi:hypothetical protein